MTAIEFNSKLLNLEQGLTRYAYSLTLEKADAKDLVQETFEKILLNKEKGINCVNFKAWSFTIMKNSFINNYKHNYRYRSFSKNPKELLFLNQIKYTGFDDPDSALSMKEITQNIDQLKDEFRIPIKMRIEGYKYDEIAKALNVKVGTIKSRVFFSRKKLMDKLNS
jgi:RNA polymerase sigma-70 factor (ECF subfamily)